MVLERELGGKDTLTTCSSREFSSQHCSSGRYDDLFWTQ